MAPNPNQVCSHAYFFISLNYSCFCCVFQQPTTPTKTLNQSTEDRLRSEKAELARRLRESNERVQRLTAQMKRMKPRSTVALDTVLGPLRSNRDLAELLASVDDDENLDPVLDMIRIAAQERHRFRRDRKLCRNSGKISRLAIR